MNTSTQARRQLAPSSYLGIEGGDHAAPVDAIDQVALGVVRKVVPRLIFGLAAGSVARRVSGPRGREDPAAQAAAQRPPPSQC